MSNRYELLLSPIQVGNVLLKNRMVSTAGIPHMLQGTEEYPTDRLISHLSNRAKNGAAAVYLNFAMRTDEGPGGPPMKPGEIAMSFPPHDTAVNIAKTSAHNYLCQTIDAIRYYESIAITQPMGSFTRNDMPGGPMKDGTPQHGGGGPIMPSDPMEQLRQEQEQCRGRSVDHITKKQIQEFIDSTVANAKILKQFGFEMFSFHNAYHNGTMAEFWSTHTNHRTDEYGGSAKNRARLMIEVMDAMKQTFGRDFPLEMLISVDGLGVNRGDTFELAKLLEGKVDILHVRHGDKDPQHPIGFTSSRAVPCPNLDAAAALKESIMSRGGTIKVGVSAGLQNPDFNEKILREHKADIICMSRAWICDSDYGKKIYAGRGEDVTPCIKCMRCHDSTVYGHHFQCAVNPTAGLEASLNKLVQEPGVCKRVAVIGGGPAGMKAACVAADRGHQVTLFEAEARLGGMLHYAGYFSFKYPVKDYMNWLIGQVNKRPIDVKLGTKATPETVQGYDAVLVAIGAAPLILPVPGVEQAKIAIETLGHEEELGDSVVLIGGGQVGCETALHYAKLGKKVTVMEMQSELAPDASTTGRNELMTEIAAEPNFIPLTGARCISLTATSVTYEKDGKQETVTADSVVLSAGMKAKTQEADSFIGTALDFAEIGDCVRARTVEYATKEAYYAAVNL